ncbi:hypothetical protein MPSEU_001074100 [Mayamaea pseudoterrestris]|nr:hypothetical protein MPSEU_001074100 [Mayamaea pseudoterrestris]
MEVPSRATSTLLLLAPWNLDGMDKVNSTMGTAARRESFLLLYLVLIMSFPPSLLADANHGVPSASFTMLQNDLSLEDSNRGASIQLQIDRQNADVADEAEAMQQEPSIQFAPSQANIAIAGPTSDAVADGPTANDSCSVGMGARATASPCADDHSAADQTFGGRSPEEIVTFMMMHANAFQDALTAVAIESPASEAAPAVLANGGPSPEEIVTFMMMHANAFQDALAAVAIESPASEVAPAVLANGGPSPEEIVTFMMMHANAFQPHATSLPEEIVTFMMMHANAFQDALAAVAIESPASEVTPAVQANAASEVAPAVLANGGPSPEEIVTFMMMHANAFQDALAAVAIESPAREVTPAVQANGGPSPEEIVTFMMMHVNAFQDALTAVAIESPAVEAHSLMTNSTHGPTNAELGVVINTCTTDNEFNDGVQGHSSAIVNRCLPRCRVKTPPVVETVFSDDEEDDEPTTRFTGPKVVAIPIESFRTGATGPSMLSGRVGARAESIHASNEELEGDENGQPGINRPLPVLLLLVDAWARHRPAIVRVFRQGPGDPLVALRYMWKFFVLFMVFLNWKTANPRMYLRRAPTTKPNFQYTSTAAQSFKEGLCKEVAMYAPLKNAAYDGGTNALDIHLSWHARFSTGAAMSGHTSEQTSGKELVVYRPELQGGLSDDSMTKPPSSVKGSYLEHFNPLEYFHTWLRRLFGGNKDTATSSGHGTGKELVTYCSKSQGAVNNELTTIPLRITQGSFVEQTNLFKNVRSWIRRLFGGAKNTALSLEEGSGEEFGIYPPNVKSALHDELATTRPNLEQGSANQVAIYRPDSLSDLMHQDYLEAGHILAGRTLLSSSRPLLKSATCKELVTFYPSPWRVVKDTHLASNNGDDVAVLSVGPSSDVVRSFAEFIKPLSSQSSPASNEPSKSETFLKSHANQQLLTETLASPPGSLVAPTIEDTSAIHTSPLMAVGLLLAVGCLVATKFRRDLNGAFATQPVMLHTRMALWQTTLQRNGHRTGLNQEGYERLTVTDLKMILKDGFHCNTRSNISKAALVAKLLEEYERTLSDMSDASIRKLLIIRGVDFMGTTKEDLIAEALASGF